MMPAWSSRLVITAKPRRSGRRRWVLGWMRGLFTPAFWSAGAIPPSFVRFPEAAFKQFARVSSSVHSAALRTVRFAVAGRGIGGRGCRHPEHFQ